MYELIIFTMMEPNVEPKWTIVSDLYRSECIELTQRFEESFSQVEDLVYTFKCKRVDNKDDFDMGELVGVGR